MGVRKDANVIEPDAAHEVCKLSKINISLARKSNDERRAQGDVWNADADAIKETLADGEKVKISGFGNFVVRDKNSRKGRNPQTGQEILLDARKVLTFKPSKGLKLRLNH